jgi:hypothetical protein
MTLLPASEEFLSKFPSSRYLSSSGSYPLDLSGVGDPAGSNVTSGLALRVTGTHKPLHHNKVEIPSGVCRVSTLIFLRQTICLGKTVLSYSGVTIHGAHIASSCVDSIVSLL